MASQQGVIGTWLVAEGIIIYRVITRQHRPPIPGELLASSGLFLLLGLLAIGAPSLAVTMGVGIDIAAFMNLAGSGKLGQSLSGPPVNQPPQYSGVAPTPVVPPLSQTPFGGWWGQGGNPWPAIQDWWGGGGQGGNPWPIIQDWWGTGGQGGPTGAGGPGPWGPGRLP